ncbi:MAG: xanthine phosphoribosyltransferase [Clostridia bacterium]|nr:xanthine phosphoribosyltransferase [Clostridia bacterium]
MQLLENAIREKGRALNSDVLLVDSFLNNQVDTALMAACGQAFAEAVRDQGIDRVVTIEASGIAPAMMTAMVLNVPMVILKKSPSKILNEGTLQAEVFSFTKGAPYHLTMKTAYVHPGEKVLLIDDFLAMGEAAKGAASLIERAGAEVRAIGIVIEKSFQPGRGLLEGMGYKIISLARVAAMSENGVTFGLADA